MTFGALRQSGSSGSLLLRELPQARLWKGQQLGRSRDLFWRTERLAFSGTVGTARGFTAFSPIVPKKSEPSQGALRVRFGALRQKQTRMALSPLYPF
jgi:hypothetical protein